MVGGTSDQDRRVAGVISNSHAERRLARRFLSVQISRSPQIFLFALMAGTTQDHRVPTPHPRPSDPAPRRGLALAGVPAPWDAPFSTHSARARAARSIELDRCTGATQKSTVTQRRRGPVEACERHHQIFQTARTLIYDDSIVPPLVTLDYV